VTEGVASRILFDRIGALDCGVAVAVEGGVASVATVFEAAEPDADVEGEVVTSAAAWAGFTNVRDGAFGGGVASAFIFVRTLSAA
jgi:hypothetical protein